ncbi:sulfite exporter TauE/SafE family protein [Salinibaculum rarum]|uniref:sulfite exporter TauE/SafE family protein n=1 Tax=Salinibaculum rarum TaxID=3058903 RepID=UPI00265FA222|nr:sulfite exporter TauE/SafE family protein [Salinibaculum sp. KK48]
MAPVQSTIPVSPDLALFFLIGLLAGAHCLGMCGPLVSMYADRMTANRQPVDAERVTLFDVRQHGLFNVGRTVGYAAMGALLGLLGSVVVGGVTTLAPIATTVRGSVGIVVGLFIVSTGLGYVFRGTTATSRLSSLPGLGRVFRGLTGWLTERVDRVANSTGIAGVGVVHALLPCPILYPAYLYAFAVGDPVRGALALGLLGAGTIPTLFVYGLALGSLSVGHRRTLHRVLGVVFLALGYLPLAHGLMLFGVALPYPDIPYYQPL